MAVIDDLKIEVNIEPVVKLNCMNAECLYNMIYSLKRTTCNLKRVVIGEDWRCREFLNRADADVARGDRVYEYVAGDCCPGVS